MKRPKHGNDPEFVLHAELEICDHQRMDVFRSYFSKAAVSLSDLYPTRPNAKIPVTYA
jgi:hypothetical protein